jgi:hypothetical protein
MRRLVHIPIIHTSADLGSLSASVQAHYTRVSGGTSWTEREQVIQALWTDIQRNLDALHLEGPRTRIYQDGLPICGFEERIVRELANAGSSNHQLILRLLDQGAILMGTEDPQLLMEEYELQKRCFPERTGGEKTGTGTSPGTDFPRFAEAGSEPVPIFSAEERRKRSERVLEARDRFIAERIAATLEEGEVGLLFLGALHRLDALKSIGVRLETLAAISHETVRRPRT